MSLTADDFEQYLREDDDGEPLGDALTALALDIETDAVDAVREIRERYRRRFSTQTFSSPW